MDTPSGTENLRNLALDTFKTCLRSVDPEILVKDIVEIDNTSSSIIIHDIYGDGGKKTYSIEETPNILIVGAGKASQQLCKGIVKLFDQLTFPNLNIKCYINYPDNQDRLDFDVPKNVSINFLEATHPLPKESTISSTEQQLDAINQANKDTLMIALLSGGGSSLLEAPVDGISLSDLQATNQVLLSSGASIQEVNTIRKHISKVKGGLLAKTALNGNIKQVIGLYLSDVIGNDLSFVASGPTCPDLTTFQECIDIANKYSFLEKIPESARQRLLRGVKERDLETPKQNDSIFSSVFNVLIGSSDSSALAAKMHLESKGFPSVHIFTSELQGEARIFGSQFIEFINDLAKERKGKSEYRAAFIGTGEFTVTIKGDGIGGRNQEMLLSFLRELYVREDSPIKDLNFAVVSCAFDGIEGNSPVTGAVVDSSSVHRLRELKDIQDLKELLDSTLNNNDSYSLLNKMGDTISTSGYTGTNVNDMTLILVESIRNNSL